jgi:hypothetical protein
MPRYLKWNYWEGTKHVCGGCYCGSVSRAIVQSQQELQEFVAQTKQLEDSKEASRKQKIVNGAKFCEMGGLDCDISRCFEDGIFCTMGTDDRCAPHWFETGDRTIWKASSTPASCDGCLCNRKNGKPKVSRKEREGNPVRLVTKPIL